ncbi:MAG TPA: hypothetical protein VFZ65_09845 [Planctomycetota bacterium]|nr:hypothetical protein [Planctomycetota bacterium]
MLFCHPESDATAAKHKGLGKQLGVVGLPGIAFLTATGEVVVQIPASEHSVAQFERYAARAHQLLAWRAAAAGGDGRAAAALLIAQLEERQLDRAAAEVLRRALHDETGDEKARLDELLLDLRIGEELRAAGSDRAVRRALGARYLGMLRHGPVPSPDVSRGFWYVILEHCEAAGDADGFAAGLEGMRVNVARTSNGAEWGRQLLSDCEAKLAKLRAPNGR